MKNIYIVPRVFEAYKNQFEISLDLKWYDFLKKVYKNVNIFFELNRKIDLIILSGGNDLPCFSTKKNDKIRNILNLKALKNGIKNNIPIIGVCAGAQFIAKQFNSKLIKTNTHLKKHLVEFNLNKIKKNYHVNSFHNYKISKLSKQFYNLGISHDKSCEFFKHKKYNIYGLMWHPERERNTKSIDKYIFKKLI
jgi:N5-(cytidine 5'-diphosphoramidyl)-L-glutamine hydrolase